MNKIKLIAFVSLVVIGNGFIIENCYADNSDFLLKVNKAKKAKLKSSNKVNTNLSFSEAVKLQKKHGISKFSAFRTTSLKLPKNNSFSFAEIIKNNKNQFSQGENYEQFYAYDSSISDISLKKFIMKKNSYISDEEAGIIASSVSKYSNEKNIDPKLIIALLATESNFDRNAISSVGAMGVGQLMPGTAQDLGVTRPFSLADNVKGTVTYLSQLMNQFNGDLDLSLASYNMGPNAVQAAIRKGEDFPSSVRKYVSDIKFLQNKINIVKVKS